MRATAVVLIALLLAAGQVRAEEGARPQLSAAEAARHRVADYLGDWRPQPLDARAWTPDFIVATDGSGTHRTLQAALDALPADGRRHYIRLRPGTYREQACARGKAPFTLYGEPGDATAVVIVEGHYNAEPKPAGRPVNACVGSREATSHGTAGSSTLALIGDDIQIAHLTVANDALERVRASRDYPAGAGERGGAQAVALMLQGERIQLQGLRLLGHQDTLHAASGRIHVADSQIAGDVDFVFGAARLVIERSVLLSRAGRRAPGEVAGYVLAPSTPAGQGHGFLVSASRLVAEPGLAAGSVALGRAWDAGVTPGAWQAGISPNGQALVRDSELGPHLGPWSRSTARREFDPHLNRLAEFNNRALLAPERQALGPRDGWAAAEGGTRGGAAAAPGDVYEVRDRAGLVAALAAAGDRPKIVRVHGRIDLSVDAAGRPLGYEDYRDPAFDFAAYVRAYDPATWGREPPSGPLEQARQRSARRQAERVVIRVPSHTTLIGIGADAGFVNGGLMLDRVDGIILRNLHFSDAYDHFPAWDPKDNGLGEWNSEYDNVSLRGATHVWIDHCTFDDGARPDPAEPIALGRRVQHHDGLLDITQQSNYVTVSWSRFSQHDKTNLVGSSDGQQLDEGWLKVTFHHNLWEEVKERTPRVRYGQVHLYNNLFVGRSDAAYAYGYSIGIGFRSRIVSERNVWELSSDIPAARLARPLKGQVLLDRGSLLNGRPLDLLAALRAAHPGLPLGEEVGWVPQFVETLDEAGEVAARVRAGAGAGRL